MTQGPSVDGYGYGMDMDMNDNNPTSCTDFPSVPTLDDDPESIATVVQSFWGWTSSVQAPPKLCESSLGRDDSNEQ